MRPDTFPHSQSVPLTDPYFIALTSLYAPADSIAALDTADKARAFFRRSFRSTAEHPTSVIELMGEDQVVDDFMKGRRGGLTQVSVDPVAYPQGRGVLVGDAAHAMGASRSHSQKPGLLDR